MPRYANETKFLLRALLAATLTYLIFASSSGAESPYSEGKRSVDGIGKYYFGREISTVMGHRGARWLERSTRQQEERTDLLIDALPLNPDMVVADIGAGSGYFSIPIAKRLPAGKVLAIDIQAEMLTIIKHKCAALGINNIELVRSSAADPKLPQDRVDLALLVDAYHEFEFPKEMTLGIFRGLKSGGRVVLVEYRAEDPSVPILRLHKMSEAQAKKEWLAAGFEFEKNLSVLPQQHIFIFRKP
ncbi:MAG: class I SAM-dependent methyltransferase [Pseudomonadota bacterium]